MVRINLLLERKQQKSRASASTEPSQLWLVALLAALLVEVVCIIVVEKIKRDELELATSQNNKVRADIEGLSKQIVDHEGVKKQLTELRAREESILKLQAARTGPTATLLELSRILAPGRGPTVDPDKLAKLRRENSSGAFNQGWDPQRLWLLDYIENDRSVRVRGLARDSEDVAELQRRLAVSDYFYDVNLLPGTNVLDDKTKLEVFKFELSAKVRY